MRPVAEGLSEYIPIACPQYQYSSFLIAWVAHSSPVGQGLAENIRRACSKYPCSSFRWLSLLRPLAQRFGKNLRTACANIRIGALWRSGFRFRGSLPPHRKASQKHILMELFNMFTLLSDSYHFKLTMFRRGTNDLPRIQSQYVFSKILTLKNNRRW